MAPGSDAVPTAAASAAPSFGAPGSWVRDFAAVGALAPASAIGTLSAFSTLTDTVPASWIALLGVTCTCSTVGMIAGALLAVPLRATAWWLWLHARLVAFAVGPLAGALVANGMAAAVRYVLGTGSAAPMEFVWYAGLGAFGMGPPWSAYLVLRSLDKATEGVVAAAAAWMFLPAGLLWLIDALS